MHRRHRLRSSGDFRRVTRDGARVEGEGLVLYHSPRDGDGPARVGFAVGRQIGNAVRRNRVKRILREAVRPLIPRLAGHDVVVVARPRMVDAGADAAARAVAEAAARADLLRPTSTRRPTT